MVLEKTSINKERKKERNRKNKTILLSHCVSDTLYGHAMFLSASMVTSFEEKSQTKV